MKKRHFGLKANTWKDIFWLSLIIFVISIVGSSSKEKELYISPVPQKVHAKTVTPTVTPTPTLDPISSKIKEVFGKYADQAIEIAKCESSLNPSAVGDGGRSIGLFQIHKGWQRIENDRFLFDLDLNTRIAHKIFTDSGSSWKLWSCSRIIGLK